MIERQRVLGFLVVATLAGRIEAVDDIFFAGSGGCDEDDPACVLPVEGADFIYTLSYDGASNLSKVGIFSEISQPAWLLGHSTDNFNVLYAVEAAGSQLWALNIVRGDAHLYPVLGTNGDPVEVGDVPVHLSLDVTGGFLFVANYVEGSLAAVELDPNDGSLSSVTSKVYHYGSSVEPIRQNSSHVHGTFVSPGVDDMTSIVYAMDLGLDRVFWYQFDASTGMLVNGTGGAVDDDDDNNNSENGSSNYAWTPLESGPRHMVMQALESGDSIAHVVCELSSTIVSFAVDSSTGALTEIVGVVSTLPEDSDLTSLTKAAEILISVDSQGSPLLYASNRGSGYGSDSVAVFSASPENGKLSAIQFVLTGESFPRGMAFLRSNSAAQGLSLIVGGQDSNDVEIYNVDESTGLINESASAHITNISTPVAFSCLRTL